MRRLGPVAALVAALAMLGAAAAAHADSLVYMNGGNVWIAHGDGSNPKQVTGGPNTWAWPSADDAGHIFVAGGQERISAGMEDAAGSEVYELNQQGANLIAPANTPGSYSTVNCPTYPPVGLRVAADGQHFVYHSFFCDHTIVELGTTGGNAFTSTDYIDGDTGMVFPTWIDSSSYLVSRGGVPVFSNDATWGKRKVGQQVNYWYPWFQDSTSSASGFDGEAITRDGSKFASIEEDGSDWGGAAHNVELRLFTGGTLPDDTVDGVAPTYKCQFSLPADPQSTLWYDNASPSFSPDGTKLAFAEPDGIHIANVSAGTCGSAPLVIPGGTQPFWSGGDESPNAGYVPPSAPPAPPAKPAPDTTPPVLSTLRVSPKRFAVSSQRTAVSAKARKGATVRYVLSEPARVSFKIELVTKKKRKTVLKTKGTLLRSGQSGANQLAFSGRIGSRKLSAGKYEIVATAVDAAGNRTKNATTTTFTIVRK